MIAFNQPVLFKSLVAKSLSLYSNLKSKTGADSTPRPMAQLLVRALKRRDAQLVSLHQMLTNISSFLRPVLDLDVATSLLVTDLKQTSKSISQAQMRR